MGAKSPTSPNRFPGFSPKPSRQLPPSGLPPTPTPFPSLACFTAYALVSQLLWLLVLSLTMPSSMTRFKITWGTRWLWRSENVVAYGWLWWWRMIVVREQWALIFWYPPTLQLRLLRLARDELRMPMSDRTEFCFYTSLPCLYTISFASAYFVVACVLYRKYHTFKVG